MDSKSYAHIKTEIGANPIKYNIAISSINARGSLGELNLNVLKSLGYDPNIIEEVDVSKGYFLLEGEKKKPILFIVTVGNENVGISLKQNLSNALKEYQKYLYNRNVWVPLMGTGVGKLHFVDSYDTTIGVLKQFSNINFTIAVPNDKRGEEFIATFRVDNLTKETTKKKDLDNLTVDEKKEIDINLNENLKNTLGNVNYFVAGHLWSGQDQLPRFVENNIWENGHDKNDTYAVNSARKNDIVFIKTTYVQNKISYLRVKAIGVVLSNKNDGHNLEVNWYIFGDFVNIENLGKYRRTFARVNELDVNTILENILHVESTLTSIINRLKTARNNKVEVEEKLDTEEKLEIKTITTTVAGLLSDVDSGADYLDISKDVDAFAKVMAAKSFSPPLAIALLGKWGSGKSFFMRKLKERIEILSSTDNSSKAYCSGVAHVHFNAWSYMDSNLWASIITKIFEGLQEYITNDSKANKEKKRIENTLTKKLKLSNDEIIHLEKQKKEIDKKIKILDSQKTSFQSNLHDRINEIKNKSIKDVLSKLDESFNISGEISKALNTNDSFVSTTDKLKQIVPEEYWQNPTVLYNKTKSKYTYVKTFFKGTSSRSNLKWFGIIIISIIAIKVSLNYCAVLFSNINLNLSTKACSFITIGIGFIIRNIQTFKQLQPLISKFWKIKEDYQLQKKDAIFKINQEEKALSIEIENFRTKIEFVTNQICQAKEFKADIEYRLEHTLTTEALYDFIERRSDSDDYKKHLGIVSIIRKDFEILSELFSGHNNEYIKHGESDDFKNLFDKPLERIILYIDDLDRCSDDRVVEVLEAVNLLMAYPLFVVVVGVDPRWVKNALTKKHNLQFNKENDSDDFEAIEASSYLEKIFQVPFQLKAATDKSVKHMLKALAESQQEAELETEEFLFEDEGALVDNFDNDTEVLNVNEPVQEIITKETIESLKFSEQEIKLLQSMSIILGTSPRSLKRFVNIYRVIKAHEDFNYTNEKEELELLTVMFLIALPIGKYRKIYACFSKRIGDENVKETFATFLLEHTLKNEIEDPNKIRNTTLIDLKTELYNALGNVSNSLLSQSIEDFKKHYDFIKRFTFNNL